MFPNPHMKIMSPAKPCNFLVGYLSLFVWGFLLVGIGSGENSSTQVKVGLVLDLQTSFSKISQTSINISLSDFHATHSNYSTSLSLIVRDSKKDAVAAAAAALDLIQNEQVSAIIGPQSSTEANFMINLAEQSKVPIITFSATSSSLTSIRSPYFIRATLTDTSQVKAIAAVVKSFGWRNAVVVYVDDPFGQGILLDLADALDDVDTRVAYRSPISPEATDDEILQVLYKLMTMQTRVFVAHMLPSLGFRVFAKAREIGMMEDGYVWILTAAMTNLMATNDRKNLENMEGVLGVRTHVWKSRKLEDFRKRWKAKFQKENPEIVEEAELNVFALWAYDAVTALSMAVEKASVLNVGVVDNMTISRNITDLRASRYGPTLLHALLGVRFKGITGEFCLKDGRLDSSTFEIINLTGNGERVIGFWTREKGLVKKLNGKKRTSTRNSVSKDGLEPVIWPGESTSVPRGWEFPTNGAELRVGVPEKRGFENFVKVTKDPTTNSTIVTGYCKEVFEAVLGKLPYAITPKYIPYETPEEKYDDMVYQVYVGKFDAVVGDVTIRANRSKHVDFTLPYTESGVSMFVPLRNNKDKSMWVFLKPWSWELWVTSVCFFVFIGFAVWVLEHRVNPEFRGPPQHQIGTSVWFSFSTMVFAHREKVVSNLARFLVIVWCFVVLVLTQGYTASLTSLLTVQQLKPTVTSVNLLLKNGDYVGYQRGTFVLDILKSLGFDDSKIIAYESAEELHELFSNGSVAAAFEEVPYVKVFLSQYCSKYAMVEPFFKTAGFGFVFPLGSPLTSDVSRAILNVTEGEELKQIERKWLNNQSDCPDPDTFLSSDRLSLSSFWGLFLIAGIASFLALLGFLAMFLYEHSDAWHLSSHEDDSKVSIWRQLGFLLRIFNQKDMNSHMFRESGNNVHGVISIEGSPDTHFPPSPSSAPSSQCPPTPSSPSRGSAFSLSIARKRQGTEEQVPAV